MVEIERKFLVKSLPGGRHGMAYPELTWEPKMAFAAVAEHFGNH